jgi:hypothetical protein
MPLSRLPSARIDRRRLLSAAAIAGLATHQPAFRALARQATPTTDEQTVATSSDVIDFTLTPDGRWDGPFSSVTFRLHQGYHAGGDVWFIRTDASDRAMAEEDGLVYVPLLRNALQAPESLSVLYEITGGVDGQRPVFSATPAQENYSPALHLHRVRFSGEPELLDSAEKVETGLADGRLEVEATELIVNYPMVVWPGGELAADEDLLQPLGAGPLIEAPDLERGEVTFKLHACYPGSRYIATDTSAVPMAPMMGIVGSGPTQQLIAANATAPIYVFANGLAGPGPMGFQPSIFNAKAGDVIWSPFWEHFTVAWSDPDAARVLESEAEVLAAVEDGDLILYNGTPDTHPDSFVVNCPAPVLAPTDYDPAAFPGA